MIPISFELFGGFIGISLFLVIIGFLTNPKMPILMLIAGIFVFSQVTFIESFIMGYVTDTDGTTETIYSISSNSGISSIHNGTGNIVLRGEFLSTSSSQLNMKEFNCIEFSLRKAGSPPLSTPIIIAVWGNTITNNMPEEKLRIATFNVTQITPSLTSLTFKRCLADGETYTLTTLDTVGVMYRAGDASNSIAIEADTTNPFDGTITHERTFNDATNAWQTGLSNDEYFKLTLENETVSTQQILEPFNETEKMLYALYGASLMLIGVIVLSKEQ